MGNKPISNFSSLQYLSGEKRKKTILYGTYATIISTDGYASDSPSIRPRFPSPTHFEIFSLLISLFVYSYAVKYHSMRWKDENRAPISTGALYCAVTSQGGVAARRAPFPITSRGGYCEYARKPSYHAVTWFARILASGSAHKLRCSVRWVPLL